MSIERGTQQAPANFSLLTRPTSAHEDPAAGFSFTKAKPVQPLDFSRKAASKANLSSTSIAPSTSLQKETQNGPRSQPETDERQVAASLAKSTSESRSSPKEASACKNIFAVPFPNVAGMSSQNCNPSFSHSKEEQDKLPPLSAAPAANEVSVSSDETLVELEVSETNAASDKANRSNNLRKPMPGSPESGKGPHIATDKAPRQQIKPLKTACLPTQAPRVQARVLSKATNKQRKKRPSASNQNAIPTEGDLLQMLLYKHQQNDQERQVLLDTLQAKEAKYQELWAASEDLYSQYHDVSQKYSKSEGQLMKIKEAKPAWEKKIRKLSDYVKGLTNDHNRLRDDAKNIQERQQSVLTDKDSIFDTLRDVVKVTEERYSASKQQVTVARHDLEVLGKTVSNHQSQLHQEHALVLFERERNNRIEKQISTLTAGHAQLLITLTGHRDTITTNISEVLHSFEQVHATTPPSGQDSLKPMLEQCILSLKYLSERESGAKPADLQQFNDTMRQHFDE